MFQHILLFICYTPQPLNLVKTIVPHPNPPSTSIIFLIFIPKRSSTTLPLYHLVLHLVTKFHLSPYSPTTLDRACDAPIWACFRHPPSTPFYTINLPSPHFPPPSIALVMLPYGLIFAFNTVLYHYLPPTFPPPSLVMPPYGLVLATHFPPLYFPTTLACDAPIWAGFRHPLSPSLLSHPPRL